jgi:glucose/arabinose dehydrogenase
MNLLCRWLPWLLSSSFGALAFAAPFAVQGPGVVAGEFRVTTLASGLNYPLGMAMLPDGSLLVAVNDGSSFWNSSGRLIRLVDADGDGVADGPGETLFSGLPGKLTALRVVDDLVFVAAQGHPIVILRLGDPLTSVGTINIEYPSGSWLHPHSALAVRPAPGLTGSYELVFQIGSDENFAKTERTVTMGSADVAGASGELFGDSIYRLTIHDGGTSMSASGLVQLATGVRNAAGFAFHPETGDLYFQDNGIDGLSNANEPLSADELNVIPAGSIGVEILDFGFPESYVEYRTGAVIGGFGVLPMIAFQPIPPPDGAEAEGANDIVFAPPGFPPGLNRGLFVGFHGKFNIGGLSNEENPVVYANLDTLEYFHFVGVEEPGIGHLDGLLAVGDSLFASDLSSGGSVSNGAGRGVIYQIRYVGPPVLTIERDGDRALGIRAIAAVQ